jgi:hypothetical protein
MHKEASGMGWDAQSSTKLDFKRRGESKIVDPKIRKAFHDAAKRVIAKAGHADPYLLQYGGLDFRECGMILCEATKASVRCEGWSVNMVKGLWVTADWNFDYSDYEAWHYWSAREFLRVCAENNLEIKFSY